MPRRKAMADVSFDPAPVGAESQAEEIVVENLDPEPLVLAPAAITGPDAAAFRIAGDDCDDAPLEQGDLCVVTIVFTPQRLGAHTATLEIAVDDDPVPLSLQLAGEGIAWLRITPLALDFGTLPLLATSAPQEVMVENVSGRVMSLLFAQLAQRASGFRIESDTCRTATMGTDPDGTLAPGETCRVTVVFTGRRRFAGTEENRLILSSGLNQALTAFNEIGSVPLRGTTQARPVLTPVGSDDTPDVSAQLGRRLRAALARLRAGGRGRAALLRRGFVVRGIVPPVPGLLGLEVWARGSKRSPARLVAVRRRLPAKTDRRNAIQARLTRAGRRLLRSGRPLVLEIELTMTAQADKLVSNADGVLRLAARP